VLDFTLLLSSYGFVVKSSVPTSCMASIVGPSLGIVTASASRNEPQVLSKITALRGNSHSPLWFSCTHPNRKAARNHFQLKSSNGLPLNAVSSNDGLFLTSDLHDLFFFFIIMLYIYSMKLNFNWIEMVGHAFCLI